MKTSILCCLFVCAALAGRGIDSVAAEGTANFANAAAGLNAPASSQSKGQPVQGPAWRAQLLIRQADSSFVQVATAPFETGALAGYFLAGRVSIPGSEPGQSATFKVRVVNDTTFESADSEPVVVLLGGGKMPPANLLGLESIQVPPAILLSINRTDQHIVLSWPKHASEMILQSSPQPCARPWQNVLQPKTTNATAISTTLDISNTCFFRLSSF